MKSILALAFVSLGALSSTANAITAPAASAYIDWDSFFWNVIDTNTADGVDAALTWDSQWSNVNTNVATYTSDYRDDWTSQISAVDGVASATADQFGLQATFSSSPTTLNASAWADRYGSFTLTANTLVTFSVLANTSIDMNSPINGSAYAWSGLDADGVGFDGNDSQHGGTSKISWANGLGNPVNDKGRINASFFNGTDSDMAGTIHAYASATSYGFIPVVPEPETYAMLLAGLGLMSTIAYRRKNNQA